MVFNVRACRKKSTSRSRSRKRSSRSTSRSRNSSKSRRSRSRTPTHCYRPYGMMRSTSGYGTMLDCDINCNYREVGQRSEAYANNMADEAARGINKMGGVVNHVSTAASKYFIKQSHDTSWSYGFRIVMGLLLLMCLFYLFNEQKSYKWVYRPCT